MTPRKWFAWVLLVLCPIVLPAWGCSGGEEAAAPAGAPSDEDVEKMENMEVEQGEPTGGGSSY